MLYTADHRSLHSVQGSDSFGAVLVSYKQPYFGSGRMYALYARTLTVADPVLRLLRSRPKNQFVFMTTFPMCAAQDWFEVRVTQRYLVMFTDWRIWPWIWH